MTLEDFFTLTEMKDGLTAPSRVEELVAVMQNEKDCVVKNIGDATRQWAAVASTIAATENKDCLELFIQLDGLWFIDRWLKDAQKFCNDTRDGFAEESITALLRALEKLQIDKEMSVSSGIWITVNNLLDHNSSRVQDRARALFASWKKDKVSNALRVDDQSVESVPGVHPNRSGEAESIAVGALILKGNHDVEKDALEAARDEILEPKSTVCLRKEDGEVWDHTDNSEVWTSSNLDHRNDDDISPDVVSITNSVQDSSSNEKSSFGVAEATISADDHSFASPRQNNEPKPEALERLSDISEKPGLLVPCSSKVEPGATSCAEAAGIQDTATEPMQPMDIDVSDNDFRTKDNASGDAVTSIATSGIGMDVTGAIGTQVWKSTNEDAESCPEDLQDSSTKEGILEKLANLPTHSQSEDSKADEEGREHSSHGAEGSGDDSDFSRPGVSIQNSVQTEKRRSDIDLEYGIVDALEVARQVAQEVAREVAQEVEREVVYYREPSCSSSSERTMEDGVGQPGSPDSVSVRQDQSVNIPQEDLLQHNSYGEINSENFDNEAENGTLDSSQVTEVAQEPEVNAEKELCGFDLNQEVSSEDMDRPVNPISTAVSVVSASRPVATSGSPSAPLQFEGALGWKGSAATSAFRPASSRKTSDGDKSLETGGNSSGSKQRLGFLDIDLNVAEDGDEKTAGLISERLIPVSSGPHSGESSLEVGPRKSERPNLDLNRVDDDGDTPLELRMEGQLLYPPNGLRSPSPASSSSSMQQMRNFDLNDRPLLPNDSLDQGLYLGKSPLNISALKGSKPGEPVISLMGTKVEVGSRQDFWRKDFISPIPSLSNGKSLETAVDTNMARMGVLGMVPTMTYTHSPVFAYNGLTTTPTIATSPSMYGPGGSFPYMVDSRGAPVVPQLMATPSPVTPYSQSYIMGMSGATLGPNGAGPSRPNFDLNSGFAIDGSSTGGLRQFLLPSQGRTMEEQIRANSRPSSSGVGEKRKEPEGGWEPFSLNYKPPQPQQPWR